MRINDLIISRATLMSGQNLPVTNKISVKHPTVNEILCSTKEHINGDFSYWKYVSLMVSDPYDSMVWLDDIGLDYESVSAFDVFILRWII